MKPGTSSLARGLGPTALRGFAGALGYLVMAATGVCRATA